MLKYVVIMYARKKLHLLRYCEIHSVISNVKSGTFIIQMILAIIVNNFDFTLKNTYNTCN